MSTKMQEIARRVHTNIEIAMWAMLFAFVIYFIIFVLPKLPEVQTQNARIRIEQIGVENASLCEKLGIKPGAGSYNQCLLDVGEFRWKVEKRVYDETTW
jgi:hypothetical protein